MQLGTGHRASTSTGQYRARLRPRSGRVRASTSPPARCLDGRPTQRLAHPVGGQLWVRGRVGPGKGAGQGRPCRQRTTVCLGTCWGAPTSRPWPPTFGMIIQLSVGAGSSCCGPQHPPPLSHTHGVAPSTEVPLPTLHAWQCGVAGAPSRQPHALVNHCPLLVRTSEVPCAVRCAHTPDGRPLALPSADRSHDSEINGRLAAGRAGAARPCQAIHGRHDISRSGEPGVA